ncbi:MAG: sulfate transporter [Planctomycetaceae bacterium]|nr:sulfate transporter [Planctomycetaceae bacterium]
MERTEARLSKLWPQDLAAGLVVFLVAVPLSLGIASVSGAPPRAGLLSAVVGGLLVGLLSRSQTSITGPTAALTAVVAAQLAVLGSFETFLVAVVVAGLIQIALGCVGAGAIAEFVPLSVVKGLLSAVGIILILKQIPHLLGHDVDPEGEMSFLQPDHKNTFSELYAVIGQVHVGATIVGLASLAVMLFWPRIRSLKRTRIPAAIAALATGVGLHLVFRRLGPPWLIQNNHLVQIPAPKVGLEDFFLFPDFSHWNDPAVYLAGLTIALVASFESLLNSQAIDAIDPYRRTTPSNRELLAQGAGNLAVGFIGGVPMTSVTVLSSVGVYSGGKSRLTAITQAAAMLVFVPLAPWLIALVPVSCLAAILLATGVQLLDPARIKRMWEGGRYQFLPFLVTVAAIVFTDLLIGVLIGLAVSLSFVINSNLRRPIKRFVEKHLSGKVIHIELANQVSFLNRPALSRALDGIPRGSRLLLDARNTDYIDPDVLLLIRNFTERTAPTRKIEVSLVGFRAKYQLEDRIQYVDHATRELQEAFTPSKVLRVLREGNERFRTGRRLTRDFSRQVVETALGQHPLAVVLSCMDSRSTAELIFDLGVGDVFGVRVAGNIVSRKVLGSLEYGCAVAGAKLILVMGHTRCGAVTSAVKLACSDKPAAEATGCEHVEYVLQSIQESIHRDTCRKALEKPEAELSRYVDEVARANVLRMVEKITQESSTIAALVRDGTIAVVGAMYDISTGEITFLNTEEFDLEASTTDSLYMIPSQR